MVETVDDQVYLLYHYNPSLVAAIIFIVLFGLSTTVHIAQLLRRRTWYFIPFIIGGLFETVGYVGRAINAKESPNWTLGPYVIQSLLILLAPALFAASIYIILGRIIRLTDGEAHSVIRVNWITKIFVTGDVLSFLAQSAGGGMLAKAKDESGVKMAQNTITAGLGIQVLFFGFFIITSALFHHRIVSVPTHRSRELQVPWKRYLLVLYASSSLILVRSVFRMAEYVMGPSGILLSREYYLYVFDSILMFATMVLFIVYHPSAIISKRQKASSLEAPVLEGVGHEMVSGPRKGGY